MRPVNFDAAVTFQENLVRFYAALDEIDENLCSILKDRIGELIPLPESAAEQSRRRTNINEFVFTKIMEPGFSVGKNDEEVA